MMCRGGRAGDRIFLGGGTVGDTRDNSRVERPRRVGSRVGTDLAQMDR